MRTLLKLFTLHKLEEFVIMICMLIVNFIFCASHAHMKKLSAVETIVILTLRTQKLGFADLKHKRILTVGSRAPRNVILQLSSKVECSLVKLVEHLLVQKH